LTKILLKRWNVEKRRPNNVEENKSFKNEIEDKLKQIESQLQEFEKSVFEHLNLNYVSKLDTDKSFSSDEIFGSLNKNMSSALALPLDMLPEAQYRVLFGATVDSKMVILQNEKTNYKVSLEKIMDVINASPNFNPELLKAVEILDQATDLKENLVDKKFLDLPFMSCFIKYLDWNNRKTLQLHALSILFKFFGQIDLEQRYSVVETGILFKLFKLLSNQNVHVSSKAAVVLVQMSTFNIHFDVRIYLNIIEVIERFVHLIKKNPPNECLINLTSSFWRFLIVFKPNDFDSCSELLIEIVPFFKHILLNETEKKLLSNTLDWFCYLSEKVDNKNEKLIKILIKEGNYN